MKIHALVAHWRCLLPAVILIVALGHVSAPATAQPVERGTTFEADKVYRLYNAAQDMHLTRSQHWGPAPVAKLEARPNREGGNIPWKIELSLKWLWLIKPVDGLEDTYTLSIAATGPTRGPDGSDGVVWLSAADDTMALTNKDKIGRSFQKGRVFLSDVATTDLPSRFWQVQLTPHQWAYRNPRPDTLYTLLHWNPRGMRSALATEGLHFKKDRPGTAPFERSAPLAQSWQFEPAVDLPNAYQLVNFASGEPLAMERTELVDEGQSSTDMDWTTEVHMRPLRATPTQYWYLERWSFDTGYGHPVKEETLVLRNAAQPSHVLMGQDNRNFARLLFGLSASASVSWVLQEMGRLVSSPTPPGLGTPIKDPTAPEEIAGLVIEGGTVIVSSEATSPDAQPIQPGDLVVAVTPEGKLVLSSGAEFDIPTGDIIYPPAMDLGPEWAQSTRGAKGDDRFLAPGLAGFVAAGALPLVKDAYDQPELLGRVVADYVKEMQGTWHDQATRNLYAEVMKPYFGGDRCSYPDISCEWETICRNPADNHHIKGLMFNTLVQSLKTPKHERSDAQLKFVAAFERFVQRRKLQSAEYALFTYEAWLFEEMMQKSMSRITILLDRPQMPPDEVTTAMAAASYTGGGVAVVAITGTLGVGIGHVALGTSVAFKLTSFLAPFASVSGGATYATGTTVVGAGGSLAGPVAIALAGVIMTGIWITEAVLVSEFESKIQTAVIHARQPQDLSGLAFNEEGIGELVLYWTHAVSETGIYSVDRNSAELCSEAARSNMGMPEGVSGGGYRFAVEDQSEYAALGETGLLDLVTPPNGLRALSWHAAALAKASCYEPDFMAAYEQARPPSCTAE